MFARPDAPQAQPATNGRTWEHRIRPPRQVFVGFDWSRTERLIPTGAAGRHKVLGERLRRSEEE